MGSNGTGKPIEEGEIEKVEATYGSRFPDSYRAFLLRNNGRSYPKGSKAICPNGRMIIRSPRFFSLRDAVAVHEELIEDTRILRCLRMPRYLLPIGEASDDGRLFLSLAPSTYGHLYCIDWGHEGNPSCWTGDPEVEYSILLAQCEGKYKACNDLAQLLRLFDAGDGAENLGGDDEDFDDDDAMEAAEPESLISEPLPRPGPTGVHTPCGQSLTEARLVQIEKSLSISLPDDYRQFLLRNNGWHTSAAVCYNLKTADSKQPQAVYGLMAIADAWRGEPNAADYHSSLQKHCRLPAELFPIAYGHEVNDLFLAIAGPKRGHVYFAQWQMIRTNPTLLSLSPEPGAPASPALWEFLESNAKTTDSFAEAAAKLEIDPFHRDQTKQRPTGPDISKANAPVPNAKPGYPRFERDGDHLVKVMVKNDGCEYEHRAPKAIVLRVAQVLSSRVPGSVFVIEKIDPLTDLSDSRIPYFQLKLALEWFCSLGFVEQRGKEGNAVMEGMLVSDKVLEAWTKLAVRV